MPTKPSNISRISIDVGVILNQMVEVKADIEQIKEKLDSRYATKEWVDMQYGQTKKLVQGMVTVILLAVLGAIVALVVR
jgi:uncharacterized membrane protein YqgA involved in biofilm formation